MLAQVSVSDGRVAAGQRLLPGRPPAIQEIRNEEREVGVIFAGSFRRFAKMVVRPGKLVQIAKPFRPELRQLRLHHFKCRMHLSPQLVFCRRLFQAAVLVFPSAPAGTGSVPAGRFTGMSTHESKIDCREAKHKPGNRLGTGKVTQQGRLRRQRVPIMENAIPKGRQFARAFISARTGPRDRLRCSTGFEMLSAPNGVVRPVWHGLRSAEPIPPPYVRPPPHHAQNKKPRVLGTPG